MLTKKVHIYIFQHCRKGWFQKWAKLLLHLFPKKFIPPKSKSGPSRILAQRGETYRIQLFPPPEHTDYQLLLYPVIIVGMCMHTRSVNIGNLISQTSVKTLSEKISTFYQITSFRNKSWISYWLSCNNSDFLYKLCYTVISKLLWIMKKYE